MTEITVTRNDDINLPVTLKRNGLVIDIDAATDVTAALTSREGPPNVYAQAAQSKSTTGADWSKSLVVIIFAAALTATLPHAGIRLEVQVTLAGKKTTWYSDAVRSNIGAIS